MYNFQVGEEGWRGNSNGNVRTSTSRGFHSWILFFWKEQVSKWKIWIEREWRADVIVKCAKWLTNSWFKESLLRSSSFTFNLIPAQSRRLTTFDTIFQSLCCVYIMHCHALKRSLTMRTKLVIQKLIIVSQTLCVLCVWNWKLNIRLITVSSTCVHRLQMTRERDELDS